ncbi:MAG: hypothetical protein PHR35_01665 [Kiritimatiellae bacterium]|nr:hypothetical protein [Kiritimatiellia bacterium]
MDLRPYLDDLEERLDPKVEDALLAEWIAFTDGRFSGQIFCPRRPRPNPPSIAWPSVSVNAALDDQDQMVLQQFGACSQLLTDAGGALPCVRANYGSSILCSLFGVPPFIMAPELNCLPTTSPIEGGIAAIRRLIAAGVPDLHQSFGGKALAMGRRFNNLLRDYPKIRKYIWIYHPDTQGPMDVAEVVWGSGLYLDIVDHPDVVHAFLRLICDTYIAFMRAWAGIVPFKPDYNVHWNLLHKGAITLRDDSAMNFSPSMFEEFVEPYDQLLLDTFGGGMMHFCGRGDHYIQRLPAMRGCNALAMSQPHLNDMEKIFRHTVDRGIKLLGFDFKTAKAALGAGRDLHGNVHVHVADGLVSRGVRMGGL